MKKKIADVIVGSWYVGLTYLGFFLVRLRLKSPTPDPFIMPWEEE